MADRILTRTLELALPRDEVFDFFSSAENLERITPPELKFHILTPTPIDVSEGTLIDYELSMYGFPIRWQTEISTWQPPERFVDRTLRGPYNKWVHTHTFTELENGGTLIEDEVRYRLPLEPFGGLRISRSAGARSHI